MATIVAGRFQEFDAAAAASTRLEEAGFERNALASFFVGPAGQHDAHVLGGDEDASPGTEASPAGATTGVLGGIGIGAAMGAVGGPAGMIAGAAVGAHVGAFVGALHTMQGGQQPNAVAAPPTLQLRKSGILVAVTATDSDKRIHATDVLRSAGAADIECAQGQIVAGIWIDFDPLSSATAVEL